MIAEPIATHCGWLDAIAGQMSDDYLANGREQPPMPGEREGLSDLFR